MFSFSHAGKMGDILYSLYFCCELSAHYKCNQFDYHIQINRRLSEFYDKKPEEDAYLMTQESAEFVKSLLDSLPYVRNVIISEKVVEGSIGLNTFRNGNISPIGCEIRDWYYNYSVATLPRAFWKQLVQVTPNPTYRDKILFTLTDRYLNRGLDYMELKDFRDHLVFIGTDSEYQAFQENYFEVDRAELKPEDNLLTVAQYLAGAKGYMANPTGFFALAELMKINRILFASDWIGDALDNGETPFGPKNNMPLGGWANNISFHPKMMAALKELVEMEARTFPL